MGVVALERGTGLGGQWGTASLGAGFDAGRWSARARAPAAAVASADGITAGAGSPSATLYFGDRIGAGVGVVAPVGGPAVQHAWGASAWGTARVEAGRSALWLVAGGALAPGLRQVALGSASLARTEHVEWPTETRPGAPAPLPPPLVADPRGAVEGHARVAYGFDEPGGYGAATASAGIGSRRPELSIGLVAGTSASEAVRGAVELALPVISSTESGLRIAASVEVRPHAVKF